MFTNGDAMNAEVIDELADEIGGEGRIGLLWLDFGDGDRLDEILLDKGYWSLVDPNGGLVLVHSTLTNSASREWLDRMKEDEAAAKYGPFEILSMMEPHKMRQNSVTMLRRKGAGQEEMYNEPIFTAFA